MKYISLVLLLMSCHLTRQASGQDKHQHSNQGTILQAVGLMRCQCVQWAMAVITDDSVKYRIDYNNIRREEPTSERFSLSMAHDTLYYDGEAHLIASIVVIQRRHVYHD